MIVVFDIDGVIRDVANSYRRAISDTVEHFTSGLHRPSLADIDRLKLEGIWNNDWEASQELIYRYFESQGKQRHEQTLDYNQIVDFFQSRYRGTDPENWNGYITTETLLLQPPYLEQLSNNGIYWGFFSGATRGSAEYVLKKRLGLEDIALIAMEDAPGKPDPTGLLAVVEILEKRSNNSNLPPVIYVGDTVADIYTVVKAKEIKPERRWVGVGIVPPHLQSTEEQSQAHATKLQKAGASVVLTNVEQLTPSLIQELLNTDTLRPL